MQTHKILFILLLLLVSSEAFGQITRITRTDYIIMDGRQMIGISNDPTSLADSTKFITDYAAKQAIQEVLADSSFTTLSEVQTEIENSRQVTEVFVASAAGTTIVVNHTIDPTGPMEIKFNGMELTTATSGTAADFTATGTTFTKNYSQYEIGDVFIIRYTKL